MKCRATIKSIHEPKTWGSIVFCIVCTLSINRIRENLMKRLTVSLLLLLVQVNVYAADKDIKRPPHFYFQGSFGNNSGLAMHCNGKFPFEEIDCSFVQVFINTISSDEMTKRKKQDEEEMTKMTQEDIEKIKGRNDPAKYLPGILQKMKAMSDEQRNYMQDLLVIMKTREGVTDKASFAEATSKMEDLQGATCTISQTTFEHHFTRISKHKWLYNPGPEGLCNVVRIATIEDTPEAPELWKYTETIVTADQDEECKKWVEVGGTFISSWDAPRSFKFNQCKYIEFGN